MKYNLITAMVLVLSLSGCVIAVDGDRWNDSDEWAKRAEHNMSTINRLTLGRSLTTVIAEMGEPDFSEAVTQEGKATRILFYRTQRKHSDYKTTKDETTPLVFVDEALVGWGESALRSAGL